MFIYRTYFNLTNCVNDIEAAQDYLSDDDMTKYLVNDSSSSLKSCQSKISSIKWILDTVSSGHIDLETTEKLTTEELDSISDWVNSQNSDGLGEGFIDQPFATYEDTGLEGYNGSEWDNEVIVASFDWKSNSYKFKLINN